MVEKAIMVNLCVGRVGDAEQSVNVPEKKERDGIQITGGDLAQRRASLVR